MSDVGPERLVAEYQRGRLTGHELVFRLIQAAAFHDPEEIRPLVPDELLAEVRERGQNPPERPEDQRFARMVSIVGPHDEEVWVREHQAAYFTGAWRWYRFLTSHQG